MSGTLIVPESTVRVPGPATPVGPVGARTGCQGEAQQQDEYGGFLRGRRKVPSPHSVLVQGVLVHLMTDFAEGELDTGVLKHLPSSIRTRGQERDQGDPGPE
jgi:hypothetical protein